MTARQLPLALDPPQIREAPYQRSSATSREAARKARPKAPTQRDKVHAWMIAFAPQKRATMHEIAEALSIPLSSVCARMDELRQEGRAIDTNETRETPYGGKAAVWVAR